jgi:Flp pilus assembly pilin Flp
MERIRQRARGLLSDERGTTSIEYGLIAVLVAVAMLVGLKALGEGNSSSWGNTAAKIGNAMSGN